jgi:hypothetical protein
MSAHPKIPGSFRLSCPIGISPPSRACPDAAGRVFEDSESLRILWGAQRSAICTSGSRTPYRGLLYNAAIATESTPMIGPAVRPSTFCKTADLFPCHRAEDDPLSRTGAAGAPFCGVPRCGMPRRTAAASVRFTPVSQQGLIATRIPNAGFGFGAYITIFPARPTRQASAPQEKRSPTDAIVPDLSA